MSRLHPIFVAASVAAVIAARLGAQGQAAQAGQSSGDPETVVIHGCYTPITGVVYRIKESGLPQSCFALGNYKHVEFAWNQAGPPGPTGAKGDKGDKGEKGDKGDKGDTGAPGERGAEGATGPAGPQGEKGDVGAQGQPGVAGQTGAAGPAGAQGPTGPSGPQGPKGDPGGTPTHTVQSAMLDIDPLSKATQTAMCPLSSQLATGGGAWVEHGEVRASYPVRSPTFIDNGLPARGWQAQGYNGTLENQLLHVWVICVEY